MVQAEEKEPDDEVPEAERREPNTTAEEPATKVNPRSSQTRRPGVLLLGAAVQLQGSSVEEHSGKHALQGGGV